MITSHPKGTIVNIYVQPGATNTHWVGVYDQHLKLRLKAPPVDGKANKALQIFLAKEFKIKLSDVQLLKGKTTRRKTVLLQNISAAETRALLMTYLIES